MTISSWPPRRDEDRGTVVPASGHLRVEPLADAAFAPFGRVLETASVAPVRVNEGRGLRLDMPGLDPHGRWTVGAVPALAGSLRDTVAVYSLEPSTLPLPVGLVERHPLTAQLFWPLETARWLVVVMPSRPDGEPDPTAARAFVAAPGQGVVYAPGTWHLPLAVLDQPARFLMRMAESGTADDCHERVLAAPFAVVP